MDEESYKKQFESLTEGLDLEHESAELEKSYDALAVRAEFVRVLAMHCGEIYKTARKAGHSRRTSTWMAREFFRFEMTPAGNYFPGEGK